VILSTVLAICFLLTVEFVGHLLNFSFELLLPVFDLPLGHDEQEGLRCQVEDHVDDLFFIDPRQLPRYVFL